MLLILVILFVRSPSAIRRPQSLRRCRFLISSTIAYVVMDALFIVCHFNSSRPAYIWNITAFFFYVAYVVLPFSWHLFVRNFVGADAKDFTKKIEYIPIVILLAMVLVTPFTGALWEISADGLYVRGPLFLVFSYLNYFYYVDPALYAAVTIARRKQDREPYLFQGVAISAIPLIAAMVNNLVIPIYEIFPFQPFCSVIVALLAYFFMATSETDILEREQKKTIEDALQKAQEATKRAEEASRVKSSFLSNMSHDIRTPMNAIINLTELALKEEDVSVIHSYLSRMMISGNFLLGLINDILDMSKIESGELTLNYGELTRTEFLHTVDTVIQPLMDARHVNFHSELRPGEYTIRVDKLRFNQIFFNLLSNAAKFTPEGGDVWFIVDNLEAENGRLKIRFIVRDTGIGMSEEFMKHLFEPFAREHSELSSKIPGTGLGLSIAKSLTEAMGGTLTVKSELGKGSEFTAVFYVGIVSRDDHFKPAENTDETPDLAGMHILLVEDNEINTYVAQILLEKAGCIVTTAENGLDAVHAFSASEPNSFDAILMDIRMPVMDGLEATEKIRALDRTDAVKVPIIAMTADAFDDERRRTLDAGMNYHLSKPVDAQKIYAVLLECRAKQN